MEAVGSHILICSLNELRVSFAVEFCGIFNVVFKQIRTLSFDCLCSVHCAQKGRSEEEEAGISKGKRILKIFV